MTDVRNQVKVHLDRAMDIVILPLIHMIYSTAYSEYELMIRLALIEELVQYLRAALLRDRNRIEKYAVIRASVTVDVKSMPVPVTVYPNDPSDDTAKSKRK